MKNVDWIMVASASPVEEDASRILQGVKEDLWSKEDFSTYGHTDTIHGYVRSAVYEATYLRTIDKLFDWARDFRNEAEEGFAMVWEDLEKEEIKSLRDLLRLCYYNCLYDRCLMLLRQEGLL